MSSLKFDQMFKFISQYKSEINKNIPDNLKCIKCKNILINAYCVPCGCSYCCDCVNEMVNSGVENCPGQTEDCKDELITNNQVDFKVNKQISNVVMKCPEEMCVYECAIINMEEHLRVCENKSVKCPFADLGCDGNRIANEMLNDHCQSANFNHCKILIGIIDNMRNEIGKHQLKIENLEKNLKFKDEIIIEIKEEIQSIKIEKEIIKQEFDSFKQNLQINFDEINIKIKRAKIEKDEWKQEYNQTKENLEMKSKEIFVEMQKIKQDLIESINNERKSINNETKSINNETKSINNETKSINSLLIQTNEKSEMMETKLNELNNFIEQIKFARIEWIIDKIDEKKIDNGFIQSDIFGAVMKPYIFLLIFYANGCESVNGKGCSIYLEIFSISNKRLPLLFKADVTIKVSSKRNPSINKSITKYCENSLRWDSPGFSDAFDYLYCDLTEDDKILDNCFIIDCFVDMK